jgi:drug/metabolite transporter (DMT)-like permease
MKSSWMLVAASLFALMSVLVKHASSTFSPAELVFYRSAFGLVAIWGVIVIRRRRLLAPLATRHLRAHFWRGLSGFGAGLFFLPLRGCVATAVTLNYRAAVPRRAVGAAARAPRRG